MPHSRRSSLRRFLDYQKRLRERARRGELLREYGTMDGKVKSNKRSRAFMPLFWSFLTLLRGHRGTLATALGTLTVATVLGLVPLYGTKLVVDNVLDTRPLPPQLRALRLPADPRLLLAAVGVGMISFTLLAIAFSIWGRWQTTRITKRVQTAYRRHVFDHAVRLPLHRVYDLKSGGVASILREDAGGVGDLVFSLIYNPWRAIIQLLGSLVMLAFVNWKLLVGAIVLLPTVWLTHRTWIGRIRPLFRDIRATRQGIDAHATESFGGMRVVRAFGRQKSESASFTTSNHLMARQELHAWWWMRGIDIAWSILIPLASALLLWFGGSKVLHDQALVRQGLLDPHAAFTTGDLVLFLAYLTALLGPIATLAESATNLQNQLAGLDRTLDLRDEPAEFAATSSDLMLDRQQVRGRVTVQNVSFAYPKSQIANRKSQIANLKSEISNPQSQIANPKSQIPDPVLHNVSLEAAPGQTIALVGPSGAGKTTLCNLIARFYDPTAGTVRLDGVDLRNIDVGSYRRLLGIVEQDTFLFDGTIAENIAYGRRDATPQQIEDAARRASAHEFITQIDGGYDALIGERGVKLSGGQRQRLTIARAILADPRILILDEATSNLDTESERLIQMSLAELMAGRTCFVIAHRLSTIRNADRIVVIEHGRIVEQGTHDELMSVSSRYRYMVELQTHPPSPAQAAVARVAEQPVDAI
ncbi:MAG: ABC transporter ATP-binding protein [Tepidisphaerales bacterium]